MIWLVLAMFILADVLRGRGLVSTAILAATGLGMLVLGVTAFPAYFGALVTLGVCKAMGMRITWRVGGLLLISTPGHDRRALGAGE